MWASLLLATGCVSGLTNNAGLVGGPGSLSQGGSDGLGGSNTIDTPGGSSQMVVPDHIPQASACTSSQPAPRSLRRLTNAEYNATLRDLFGGDTMAPQGSSTFGGEIASYGFHDIQYNLIVTGNTIGAVQQTAEDAGTYAAAHMDKVASCAGQDAACLTTVITSFGKRAFRRPLTADEVQAYQSLAAPLADFPSKVSNVVAALLQSPYFLYRFELGSQAGQGYALTPYEVASELSYLFLGSMPDDALMQAADAGKLALGPDIAAQAQRLMKDSRAQTAISTFFLQWLQIADLPTFARTEGNTALPDDIKQQMVGEATAFVNDIVFTQNGSYADLLTANYSFINPALAGFYQVAAPAGTGFTKTAWSNAERLPGVLGLGGFLSAASSNTTASPTLRGRALRMRLLCQSIGSPPAGAGSLPSSSAATTPQTLRQTFEAHSSNATCASCHTLMDPLAFPLGGFDGLGRRRAGDMESGQPVDVTGRVNGPTVGAAQDIANGQGLATYMSQSTQAQACLSRHWSMYGLGQLNWSQDSCTFDQAAQYAAKGGAKLQDVLVGLTQTSSFTQRVQDN